MNEAAIWFNLLLALIFNLIFITCLALIDKFGKSADEPTAPETNNQIATPHDTETSL